jgi:hypothetical protein
MCVATMKLLELIQTNATRQSCVNNYRTHCQSFWQPNPNHDKRLTEPSKHKVDNNQPKTATVKIRRFAVDNKQKWQRQPRMPFTNDWTEGHHCQDHWGERRTIVKRKQKGMGYLPSFMNWIYEPKVMKNGAVGSWNRSIGCWPLQSHELMYSE